MWLPSSQLQSALMNKHAKSEENFNAYYIVLF
jgi:hypothetical protein